LRPLRFRAWSFAKIRQPELNLTKIQENLMRIREFEDTPQDYEALVRIRNTVWHEPTYTVDDLRRLDEERPSNLVHRRFLAEIADQVVGYGSFEQHQKFPHPQHFWMRLDVLPDQRQQGIGTQLYEHMLAMLQSEVAVQNNVDW
jgi:GNAT superfamily N-acetyltransferase